MIEEQKAATGEESRGIEGAWHALRWAAEHVDGLLGATYDGRDLEAAREQVRRLQKGVRLALERLAEGVRDDRRVRHARVLVQGMLANDGDGAMYRRLCLEEVLRDLDAALDAGVPEVHAGAPEAPLGGIPAHQVTAADILWAVHHGDILWAVHHGGIRRAEAADFAEVMAEQERKRQSQGTPQAAHVDVPPPDDEGEPLRRVINQVGITVPFTPEEAAVLAGEAQQCGMTPPEYLMRAWRATGLSAPKGVSDAEADA